jgi:membrane protease YdiL (CAAX protease family)
LVVGSVFGLLHWDMPGGLGIVRLVSALGLGLAAGTARAVTGSITASIVLHVAYNFLSVATVRRWVVSESFPTRYGTPTAITGAGVVGLCCAAAALLAARRRREAAAKMSLETW